MQNKINEYREKSQTRNAILYEELSLDNNTHAIVSISNANQIRIGLVIQNNDKKNRIES
jgi:hypothetical protein